HCVPLCFIFPPSAPTVISTLSLHDALPIFEDHVEARRQVLLQRWELGVQVTKLDGLHALQPARGVPSPALSGGSARKSCRVAIPDRKSTRLNSSHRTISYAVFCLKKKKKRP